MGTSGSLLPSGSEHDVLVHDGTSFVATTTFTGVYTFNNDVGIGVAPTVRLHVLDTVEQLRVAYDASNYLSVTVLSDGEVRFNATGTDPTFRFFDRMGINALPSSQAILVVTHSDDSAFTRSACIMNAVLTAAGAGNVRGVLCDATVLSSSVAAEGIGGIFNSNVNTTALLLSDQVGGRFSALHIGSAGGGTAAGVAMLGGDFLSNITAGTSKTVGEQIAGRFQVKISGTTNTTTDGIGLQVLTPSGSGHTMTNATGIKLDDLASIPTITTYYGLRIGDQSDVSIATNQAIEIDTQDGANQAAGKGNIHMAGGAFNTGHVQCGASHLWFDGTNLLVKVSAPASASDGLVFPDAADTLVARDTTDTLTSKTLTTPTIASIANVGSGSPDAQKILRGDSAWEDLEWSRSYNVEDPTSSEDGPHFFTNKAITVTEMRAVLLGSSTPSVTWTIRHGTDRNDTGAEVVTSGTTTTSVTSGDDVTSFNDATIVADSFVWLETTAKSGTVDLITITLIGTFD